MIGVFIAAVSFIVTLAVLWHQFKLRDRTRGPSRLKLLRSGTSVFRSVGIDTGNECCEAARSLSGKRLLQAEAPRLPLAQCNADQCQCRYIYFTDRREDGGDRRGLQDFGDNMKVPCVRILQFKRV